MHVAINQCCAYRMTKQSPPPSHVSSKCQQGFRLIAAGGSVAGARVGSRPWFLKSKRCDIVHFSLAPEAWYQCRPQIWHHRTLSRCVRPSFLLLPALAVRCDSLHCCHFQPSWPKVGNCGTEDPGKCLLLTRWRHKQRHHRSFHQDRRIPHHRFVLTCIYFS